MMREEPVQIRELGESFGWKFVKYDQLQNMLIFTYFDARVNIWLKRMTVGIYVPDRERPFMGLTQRFERRVSLEKLEDIFTDPYKE